MHGALAQWRLFSTWQRLVECLYKGQKFPAIPLLLCGQPIIPSATSIYADFTIMTTQLSTINAYTNTVWTPPRICGIPALLMAPFRDYRWFLPRISVVDPADDFDDSDDSENEETPLSCHSLGWTASERYGLLRSLRCQTQFLADPA